MESISWKAPSRKGQLLSHLGALLVVAVWGGSFVATKVLTENGLGPVEIYIYRFVLAYLLMLISCHKRLLAHNWRDEMLFLICGLCGSSIYFIAENTAVTYTRASDVSMITTLSPLLTTLLIAALYKSERPGGWFYCGSAIAFAGVVCIVFKDGFNLQPAGGPDSLSATIGDLLALVAAFSWAIYSVALRKLAATYSTKFVTRKTFFYGLITALPFWFISKEPVSSPTVFLRPDVIGNLLFLGVVCSVVSYVIWAAVTNKLGSITTNNYLYAQPIFTMIIAAVIPSLHDPITILGCFGCLLIIGGLWLGDFMASRKGKI